MINCYFIDIINAPLFEGSATQGQEFSYSFVKDEITCSDRLSFVDYNSLVATNIKDDVYNTKNIRKVTTKCENIRLSILESFKNKKFPIVLGGDHSVAMASIAAGSETFGIDNYAVIYIDGHADINTEETSVSHNIHGMPLAASLGLCLDSLRIGPLKKKIKGENLFILGARSIDPPEYKIIQDNGVSLFENTVFNNGDYSKVLKQIIDRIGNKKVHISFDVDVLDPSVFSSTGYLMKDGLSLECVLSMLSLFVNSLDVVSMDIVEYNPLLDNGKKDLKTLLHILDEIIT